MKFFDTNRTDNGEGKPLCTCTCYFCLFIFFSIEKKKKLKKRNFSYKKYHIDKEEKSNVL